MKPGRVLILAVLVAAVTWVSLRPADDNWHLVEEGNRLQAAARSEEAATLYASVEADTGAMPAALFNLALMRARLGAVTEAIDILAHATPRLESTDRARGYYNRGTLLASLGRLDEALADLRLSLVLDPEFENARVNYEVVAARVRAPRLSSRQRSSPDTQPSFGFAHGRRDRGLVRPQHNW